jgi:hypothetical protein
MLLLRRHLHAWTIAWLLFQTLSVSALVPIGCCDVHEAGEPACDDATVECPMHATGGDICPMHARPAGASDDHEPCAMRGPCAFPQAALSVLLPVPGILTAATSLAPPTPMTPVPAIGEHRTAVSSSNDTPPPRA